MSLTLVNLAAMREVDLDDLNVVQGAKITIKNRSDNSIASIYNSDNILDVKPNPFFADSVGQIEFFIDGGLYKVNALTVTDLDELEGTANFQVKDDATQNIKIPEDYGYTGSGDETAILQSYLDGESTWFFPNNYTVNSKLSVADRKVTCLPSGGSLVSTILNDTVIQFLRCDDSNINGLNLNMSSIDVNLYEDAFHDCFRVENSERFIMSSVVIWKKPSAFSV